MLPPPTRILPEHRVLRAAVASGESLFLEIGCGSCHIPALELGTAIFVEPGPFNPAGTLRDRDGAGVVEALGPGVKGFASGDNVWVYNGAFGRPHGTSAEFITLPGHQVALLPDGLDFAQGACLGIPGMTAHRCVFAGGPVDGQWVLVAGGSGVVGHYAVQLAKWGGAKVIATVSSPEKAEAARAGGADHVLDYKKDALAERVRQG